MVPMVRVLQVMLRMRMPLVMMMVRVLQVVVLGVGPCVIRHGPSPFLAWGLVGGVAGRLARQSCWCLW